jgi:hypothetical protein
MSPVKYSRVVKRNAFEKGMKIALQLSQLYFCENMTIQRIFVFEKKDERMLQVLT